MQPGSFVLRFKESLSHRMNERRTDVSRLFQYFHKFNQGYAEPNLDPLLNLDVIEKK